MKELSINELRILGVRVGVARRALMHCLRRVMWPGSGLEEEEETEKYSPGRRSETQYTSSAAVHWRSSLIAVRIPSNTKGRDSVQVEGSG